MEELKEPAGVSSALKKLQEALDVCIKFKEAYFEKKTEAKNSWKISSSALFVRLDAFSERCQDMIQMC
jgi:Dynein heavy chain, N-terminal region 1